MKFYNTLSRQIEQFKPINVKSVTVYSCGPTVYDFPHLGNLRAFVFVDTLRRALEIADYGVKHVMNITDVGHLVSDEDEGEDKLEAGAQREHKSVWEVAETYTEVFKRDVSRLNILPPSGYRDEKHGDTYARATSFISEQVKIVKVLLDNGFAYKTEQAIYFDVKKLPSYGRLARQKPDEQEVGARSEVITDSGKRSPQDFALWFFTIGRFTGHTMRWPSPWGEGFPGWHLECSAIIHATLGEPIDIHTGGVDHIGTHHTNEIAQTEAAFGKKLANFWLHNEHMLVDGQKMSKSLDNFFTLKDVIKKGYDPLALRLLYLQSHYRSQTNFTWESLAAAQVYLNSLRAMADLRWQIVDSKGGVYKAALESHKVAIKDALENDLNTSLALSALSSLTEAVGTSGISKVDQEAFTELLAWLDKALGLNLDSQPDISDEQKGLINQREEVRKGQDWAEADELRDKLSEQGIEINDTIRGPIWFRSKQP